MKKGNKEQLTERAAVDLARLMSEDLTFSEATELARWRDESTEYQSELLTASHMLADLEGLKESQAIQHVIDDALKTPLAVSETGDSTGSFWPKLSIAAGVVLASIVGLFAFLNDGQEAPVSDIKRYVTSIGEQRQIVLPDASVVHLNTGSELLVEMRERERKLTLRRGEAYFDVAHDANRPFSVDIGGRTVTAVGTEFNIRKQPDQFTLSVIEGVVAMHKQSEKANVTAYLPTPDDVGQSEGLQADRQYRFSAGWVVAYADARENLSAFMDDSPQALGTWRSGILSFNGTPLVDVVQELNRYSAKRILIVDADIMELEVMAGVPVGRINDALKALESVMPIEVEHDFDQILVKSAQ